MVILLCRYKLTKNGKWFPGLLIQAKEDKIYNIYGEFVENLYDYDWNNYTFCLDVQPLFKSIYLEGKKNKLKKL